MLFACLAWILYGPADVLPPYVLALVAGVASGAAMLPYTVIKEANRPEHSGTATGVVNFINFSFSALVVTASVGHIPSTSLKTAFSRQIPLVNSRARFIPRSSPFR